MGNLFNDNLFFTFLFACITIINYTHFKESQRIFLIYLVSFGLSFLSIINIFTTLLLLFVVTFIYIEILTNDNVKLKLIKKMRYKVLDYSFLIFFQYSIGWIIVSIFFTSTWLKASIYHFFTSGQFAVFLHNFLNLDFYGFPNFFVKNVVQIAPISLNVVSVCLGLLSLLFFLIGTIRLSHQSFEVKNFTSLIKYFEEKPIFQGGYKGIDSSFFHILSDLEDRTYFIRRNTYNLFSREFIQYKTEGIVSNIKQKQVKVAAREAMGYIAKSKTIRGYSTLEMQLIRSIGIEDGYDKKITRKFYEYIYTTIFFGSLKEHYKGYTYENRDDLKEYLLYIYFHSVNTKIAGKHFTKFSSVYKKSETQPSGEVVQNIKPISEWSKEEFFIACIGLPHSKFSSETITDRYYYYIYQYELNEEKLVEIVREIEGKKLQTSA